MKKSQNNDESIFKKKGFYYTLYGSLGVVMVLAAVVAFGNLGNFGEKPEVAKNGTKSADMGQLQMTDGQTTRSYLTPEDNALGADTSLSSAYTARPSQQATSPAQSAKPQQSITPAVPKQAATSAPTTATSKPAETPKASTTAAPSASPASPSGKSTSEAEEKTETTNAEAVFNPFTDDSKMAWPLLGEIVMEYSNDTAIYDVTLEHFRTNDTLCIAAEKGTQVKAAADGVVKLVTKTRENGNVVVVDDGNGWVTTYSQLQDGVLVKEGDVVKKSQVIGGVGSPSIYSVVLGNHLGFKVTKNDEAVDPMTVLSE